MKISGKHFHILALSMLCAITACTKPKLEIPKGILKQDEMIPILVDIHIAQSASNLFPSGDSLKRSMADYLPYILNVHHVERAVYDSSIAFYTLHPELMKDMYPEVINELSKKQGEAGR